MELIHLDEDTIYEYVFERYIELGANSDSLSQDLGILSRNERSLEIDIKPSPQKARSKRVAAQDEYSLFIEQSLTSLNSSRDNNNSTTGYVVWTTSTFIIKWLLYNEHAKMLTRGGKLDSVEIPSILQCEQDSRKRFILELGTGVSPMFPIVLSNYVDKYVATDQKDILPKLKYNIQENQAECRRRLLSSTTIDLRTSTKKTDLQCDLDVTRLDWELFSTDIKAKQDPVLLGESNAHLTIMAMDVIYNEYLIKPFLNTLHSLFQWYSQKDFTVSALIGIQLRTQEVIQIFLEEAVIERQFTVRAIDEPQLNQSRFMLLYITLD